MEKQKKIRVIFRSPAKCAGCKALTSEGGGKFSCKLGFVLKKGQTAPAPDGRCYHPKSEEAFKKAQELVERFYTKKGPDTALET
ncbi:hypothetical protein UFOVP1492_78 [uncultured Caudovirales phage]|uniref:Uncharacterized protein n=1 Tax=uncultured Caudovirales phage TaxID=2100421 RepID=A0A6J7XK66_9CAUD|nr:hypothetical protein UFOVP1127_56 [uncultured Caudovirales phage]CAB4193072.1 hypothetical protein UFOVP1242_18 [uncultured Caudovirales phage]CAB4217745.1 hypothetical protein UFOVP1492_78 [uncultured Caudovirales phage]CAB5231565.1 hypothetical protein UFOVP1580_107 [uncultured Caudovirales phage]